MSVVSVDAPAKVNLRLHVLAQETTGYHALESLFCAVSLADSLTATAEGGAIEVTVLGDVDAGPARDNLVTRAARDFHLALGGVEAGVRIELHKQIPAAAGLGGGSSDAAATLRALNALHGDHFTTAELLELAVGLGSDVPFFLAGSPLALGWGRGERLLALPPLPSRPVLLAHPGVAMPTGPAFQRLAELRGGGYEPRPARLLLSDLTDWAAVARVAANDFEPVADERLPQLADARARMRDAGALITLLAGSGASVFGVFENEADRDVAAHEVAAAGFATRAAHTLERMPEPRVDPAPRGG